MNRKERTMQTRGTQECDNDDDDDGHVQVQFQLQLQLRLRLRLRLRIDDEDATATRQQIKHNKSPGKHQNHFVQQSSATRTGVERAAGSGQRGRQIEQRYSGTK